MLDLGRAPCATQVLWFLIETLSTLNYNKKIRIRRGHRRYEPLGNSERCRGLQRPCAGALELSAVLKTVVGRGTPFLDICLGTQIIF